MASPREWKPVDLEVPSLGTVRGLCFDGATCEYMGIPYARVPGRFRRPQPYAGSWPESKWDGTKVGPFPSQPPRDFYPIPNPERPWMSPSTTTTTEECLSLNISVPTTPDVAAGKPLYPVMIFLHGGAFVYAAGGAPIYDGRALAAVSQEIGEPTIIISINFRLGVFGFLASKEIREYNAEHGEAGVGNYGLWDQVEAFRWVQKHIASFGGDPARVCLFGQSAGGVSVDVHLRRGEQLFSSAIIQSGLLPLCGVMTEQQYQVLYDKILIEVGISAELSARDRLQRLIDMDESRLVAAMVPACVIPVISLCPCDDGVLICGPMPRYSDYASFEMPAWCPRVIVGDAANECIIWNKSFRSQDATALTAHIHSFFSEKEGGDAAAKRLMELYDIRADMSHDETFWKTEKFTTDGLYAAVDWTLVRACPQVFYYHFDVPSPFDNEWQGLAHHSLDNVYVWSLLRDHLPPAQRPVSAAMAGAWIRFARGHDPWERFQVAGRVMVFEHDRWGMRTIEEDGARGYARWETIEREGLLDDFHMVCDELCMLRRELTDPTAKPRALVADSFEAYGIQRKAAVKWE